MFHVKRGRGLAIRGHRWAVRSTSGTRGRGPRCEFRRPRSTRSRHHLRRMRGRRQSNLTVARHAKAPRPPVDSRTLAVPLWMKRVRSRGPEWRSCADNGPHRRARRPPPVGGDQPYVSRETECRWAAKGYGSAAEVEQLRAPASVAHTRAAVDVASAPESLLVSADRSGGPTPPSHPRRSVRYGPQAARREERGCRRRVRAGLARPGSGAVRTGVVALAAAPGSRRPRKVLAPAVTARASHGVQREPPRKEPDLNCTVLSGRLDQRSCSSATRVATEMCCHPTPSPPGGTCGSSSFAVAPSPRSRRAGAMCC